MFFPFLCLSLTVHALRASCGRRRQRFWEAAASAAACTRAQRAGAAANLTARLVADLLQAAGADRVLTIDLHAPQIQGFFHIPVDQLQAVRLLSKHITKEIDLKDTVIVASDAGEAKDIGRYANRLNLPIAIIDKRRYGDDEKAVAARLVGEVEGKTALLVDDEIATGRTMMAAAKFLKEKGATRVVAASTHAVFSGNPRDELGASEISRMMVTDTVPIPREKRFEGLKVLTVSRLLAEAIRRIHDGRSVSKLFED